ARCCNRALQSPVPGSTTQRKARHALPDRSPTDPRRPARHRPGGPAGRRPGAVPVEGRERRHPLLRHPAAGRRRAQRAPHQPQRGREPRRQSGGRRGNLRRERGLPGGPQQPGHAQERRAGRRGHRWRRRRGQRARCRPAPRAAAAGRGLDPGALRPTGVRRLTKRPLRTGRGRERPPENVPECRPPPVQALPAMRLSQFHLRTSKEIPAEAELASHKLMLKAGMIRKLAAGLYTWTPLGLRVLRKVEKVVREEMDAAGAIEMLMPNVQPRELWEETGRWEKFGGQLMKMQDRKEAWYCYGPTHEEVITDFARNELASYKQLPACFYQIQTKFRDEIRPRFGVMRAREFLMKDAYSFHLDEADLQRQYEVMYQAYSRIFERLGLRFRAVFADTGAIGGSASHEFHVLAGSGEDAIAFASDSGYAANVELAEAVAPGPRPEPSEPMHDVETPTQKTCEAVAALMGIPLQRTVKTLALMGEDGFVVALLRGDHAPNEIKLAKLPGLAGYRMATEAEIGEYLGASPGFLGPINPKKPVKVIADRTVAAMADFVIGANRDGFHIAGVNWGRDLPEPDLVADLRNVVAGDPSPDGQGTLSIARGIEVGHIFQLG